MTTPVRMFFVMPYSGWIWGFEGGHRGKGVARSNTQGKPVKPDNLLTDEEFADMMKEFASAGLWMRRQLALKRSTPSADVPQPDVDSQEHQSGALNPQAIGDDG